jgi:hypothetical protein
MQNFIDLTNVKSKTELRSLLTGPGMYKIPIVNYNAEDDSNFETVVEVVYVSKMTSRMPVIIVKINARTYQDFYFNESYCAFKMLTFNDFSGPETKSLVYNLNSDFKGTGEVFDANRVKSFEGSWILEDVKDCPPEPYKSYIVKYSTICSNNFFKNFLYIC